MIDEYKFATFDSQFSFIKAFIISLKISMPMNTFA
jgi:hypothetical protein